MDNGSKILDDFLLELGSARSQAALEGFLAASAIGVAAFLQGAVKETVIPGETRLDFMAPPAMLMVRSKTRRRNMEAKLPIPMPEFLTQVQVMARYQISRSTLVRLRFTSLPDPLYIGGSPRWRRTDLERWEAAGCPAKSYSIETKKVVDDYEAAHPGSTFREEGK